MERDEKLDFARTLLYRFIGDFYQAQKPWEEIPEGFTFKSKKCNAPQILNDMGYADRKDLLCRAHEKYWQIALKEIDPNFEFQLKGGLAKGEGFCEWIVKLPVSD